MKIIIKIVIGLSIFFGISSYSFSANVDMSSGIQISNQNIPHFVAHPTEPLIYYVEFNTDNQLKILNYNDNSVIDTGIFVTKGRNYNLLSNIYNNEFLFTNLSTGKINKFNILTNSISETYNFNLADRGFVYTGDYTYFVASKGFYRKDLSTGTNITIASTTRYQFGTHINYDGNKIYFMDSDGYYSTAYYDTITETITKIGGNTNVGYGQSGYGFDILNTTGAEWHFISDTQDEYLGTLETHGYSYNNLGNFLFLSSGGNLKKYNLDEKDPNVGGGNENQTCETRLINTPYKTSFTFENGVDEVVFEKNIDNDKYILEYKKPNSTNTNKIAFLNVEDLVFNDNKTEFSFNSLDSPLEDSPAIVIESELSDINYLKLSGTGNIATIEQCFNNIGGTGNVGSGDIYSLDYSDEYKKFEYGYTKCFILTFEKSYLTENNISIEWGEKNSQMIESEICWDNEIPDEIIVNGTTFTGSIVEQIKNDGTFDEDGIGYDPNNLKRISLDGNSNGLFVVGSIQSPESNSNGTCEMFDDTGHFTYYSNGQISFNFGFDDYSSFDFGFVDLSGFGKGVVEAITGPINSFISVVGIITPFGVNDKDYCLFGTIVPYQNHRLFKDTKYYNELNFITYLILFGLYAGIFTSLFGFRNIISSSKELYKEERGEFRKVNNSRKLKGFLLNKRSKKIKDAKEFAKKNNT